MVERLSWPSDLSHRLLKFSKTRQYPCYAEGIGQLACKIIVIICGGFRDLFRCFAYQGSLSSRLMHGLHAALGHACVLLRSFWSFVTKASFFSFFAH
jgi:hypothetical protein